MWQLFTLHLYCIYNLHSIYIVLASLVAQTVKSLPAEQETRGSIPGSGRSPGEGNHHPLQYSCLENPMDGGAWRATVHGVPKSWTRLSNFTLVFLPGKFHRGAWSAASMGSQRVPVLKYKQASI